MAPSSLKGLYGSWFVRFRGIPVAGLVGSIVAGVLLSACSGPGLEEGPKRAEQATTRPTARPLALVRGAPIPREEADRRLRELAGGVVLEELVLEAMLEAELREAGERIVETDLERERALLVRTVIEGTAADEDAAAVAIRTVRRARGLGPARFEALLRRNAMLRRLVEDEAAASVSEEDLDLAMTIRYGPKARVRIIVTPSQRQAARLRADLKEAPDRFAELAMQHSVDASAARGGLLAPLSTVDPSYPLALLTAIDRLVEAGRASEAAAAAGRDAGDAEAGAGEAGEAEEPADAPEMKGLEAAGEAGGEEARQAPFLISEVIAIDGGYAIVKLEERIAGVEPADAPAARAAMREEVLLVRERSLMEQRAGRLLERADVTVFDPALDWAWRGRIGEEGGAENGRQRP